MIVIMAQTVFFLLVYGFVGHVYGYCKTPGWNPYFTGPPTVQQVNITTVLVTWNDLVVMRECADEFLVKSGQSANPMKFDLTPKLSTNTFQVIISDRLPELEYFYQVIAREDKGWRGVDYNKSPTVYFTTSRKKTGMSRDQIKEAIERTTTSTTPAVNIQDSSDGSVDDTNRDAKKLDRETTAPPPVVGPVVKQDESDWTKDYLVWIIVAAVAVAILLIGALYNIRKRMKPEGSIQLDIEIDPDDLDSDEDGDEEDDDDDLDGQRAHHEFQALKHKALVEEVEDDVESTALNKSKANSENEIQRQISKSEDT